MQLRPLGSTDIQVSAVALGCWPIAGITSAGVTDEQSLATIETCLDLGINHLDTAYMYGYDGESERLIAQATRGKRDQFVIATKCGLHWGEDKKGIHDARPERILAECEESLRRLEMDHVELYYLHAPDKNVPIADSAGAIKQLMDAGKIRAAGASNLSVAELNEFQAVCPLAAVQVPYSMLQRQIEADIVPWCQERNVSLLIYWPLMKGLLAGKYNRETVFPATDSRSRYPMFVGEEWQRNLDFVDRLREVAASANKTVAQVVVNWTIHQAGITSALCGAKRPDQIQETAGGDGWTLTAEQLQTIEHALAERGEPVVRNPV